MQSDSLLDRLDKNFETRLKEAVLKEVRGAALDTARRMFEVDRSKWEYKLTINTLGQIASKVGQQCRHDRKMLGVIQFAFEVAIQTITTKEREGLTTNFVAAVESEVYDKLAIIDSLEKLLERNKEYFV